MRQQWIQRVFLNKRKVPLGLSLTNHHRLLSTQAVAAHPSHDPSASEGSSLTTSMNLFSAINDAMSIAMETHDDMVVFGQDVAFGGVFRCTSGLREKYGSDRVFNTPLSENGIAGFAVGYASMGGPCVGEIQFADYVFPAMDQIVNEMAKFRYRSGNQWNCGGVTLRTPCGAVGHGGHYHSQSPEGYFTHTPGLVVVMPSGPKAAKGLLLSSIRAKDPVIFLEPKALYRSAVEDVPVGDYEVPLSKAEVVLEGSDVTLVGWGGPIHTVLKKACQMAQDQHGISVELVDLQTLLPWDRETVLTSIQKTGKCVVSHEAPTTCGLGAEVVATLQQKAFLHLEAPLTRVCGHDTPFPLVFEKQYIPDELRVLDAIVHVCNYAQ